MKFHKDILKIDAARVTDQICVNIRRQIRDELKKSGTVVGISGGIDSTVVSALCARALGPERVLGIMMPEQESSGESEMLARKLATQFGFESIKEDISAGLKGLGCYEKRDEAIKQLFPEYDNSYKCKITKPGNILSKDTFNFFQLTIMKEGKEPQTKRMTPGVVYTTFHFPESGVNLVTTENSDWATNCPEYKVTAVEVVRVGQPEAWQERIRAERSAQRSPALPTA